MKYYAVIDTNVIISALLKENSAPAEILREALSGCITPLLNEEIFKEYSEVVHRSKFSFSEDAVNRIMSELPLRAMYVSAKTVTEHFPDPDDVVFYEVVIGAQDKENTYLVTGNTKHFPVKPFVVTPREMLDIIHKNKP